MSVKRIEPEVVVNSAIDLRLTKNDIIEMMLAEEEERLEAAEEAAKKARIDFINKSLKDSRAAFEKKFAKTFSELQAAHPGSNWSESDSGYGIAWKLCDKANKKLMELDTALPQEHRDRDNELRQAEQDAWYARQSFLRQSKKGRVAMTRKLLESSDEGKAVLAKVNEVGKLLLAATDK